MFIFLFVIPDNLLLVQTVYDYSTSAEKKQRESPSCPSLQYIFGLTKIIDKVKKKICIKCDTVCLFYYLQVSILIVIKQWDSVFFLLYSLIRT